MMRICRGNFHETEDFRTRHDADRDCREYHLCAGGETVCDASRSDHRRINRNCAVRQPDLAYSSVSVSADLQYDHAGMGMEDTWKEVRDDNHPFHVLLSACAEFLRSRSEGCRADGEYDAQCGIRRAGHRAFAWISHPFRCLHRRHGYSSPGPEPLFPDSGFVLAQCDGSLHPAAAGILPYA